MTTTEHTINDSLAIVLQKTRSVWRGSQCVHSEQLQMLKETAGRPDILVLEPFVAPVSIEIEVLPAVNVEQEAVDRLGNYIKGSGRPILSSVALRLQPELRTKQSEDLVAELETTESFEMALFTGRTSDDFSRWPSRGWITGNINELSQLVQMASVPPEIIDEASGSLIAGVTEAAGLLHEMSQRYPGSIRKIAENLHQQDGTQTRRMAVTILINAFMFHEILAGGEGDLEKVRTIESLKGASGLLEKGEVLDEWRKILLVDFWPIFDIARRILELIPASEIKHFLEIISRTANSLIQNRLMRSHDLTGAVFQRLIIDRQFLAAYYTTPASASLLVGLALKPKSVPGSTSDWSDADAVKNIRIADFACGTGTLLTAAYRRISQLHEFSGGDARELHSDMMASSLVGCDVLPAAAHLTASMLSGAHPTSRYEQSSIMTVPYGRQPDGSVSLGSLDLLDPQGKFDILSITATALDSGGEFEKEIWRSLPHSSFDLVVMNPPFTRATVHEAETADVPNPAFAAFESSADDQKAMSDSIKELTKGTSASGMLVLLLCFWSSLIEN